MESNDFFRQYKDVLMDGIDKVRKSGYKKLGLFREMIDTLEGILSLIQYSLIKSHMAGLYQAITYCCLF
jgi:hypothetical protein